MSDGEPHRSRVPIEAGHVSVRKVGLHDTVSGRNLAAAFGRGDAFSSSTGPRCDHKAANEHRAVDIKDGRDGRARPAVRGRLGFALVRGSCADHSRFGRRRVDRCRNQGSPGRGFRGNEERQQAPEGVHSQCDAAQGDQRVADRPADGAAGPEERGEGAQQPRRFGRGTRHSPTTGDGAAGLAGAVPNAKPPPRAGLIVNPD
mmetsp:Transcript_424/g.699  ORF Transcript_424/g.699 Transcript_424/m.699 type:complete len:202 (-) Transcript_424:64-669(-)